MEDTQRGLAKDLQRLQQYPEWKALFTLMGQHMDRHNQVRGIRSEKEALRRHERLLGLDEFWADVIELPKELEREKETDQVNNEVNEEPTL